MTTKVLIEKVEEGAKYQDYVYDYWVTCRLSNNCKIVLFDYVPFDFTNVLSKSVEINIKTLFIENDIQRSRGFAIRACKDWFVHFVNFKSTLISVTFVLVICFVAHCWGHGLQIRAIGFGVWRL